MFKKLGSSASIYVAVFATVVCVGLFLSWFVERQLTDNFDDKSIAITKNVAAHVTEMDAEMDRTLCNAVMFVSSYMALHPMMNHDDLVKLQQVTGVTTISIFEGDSGRFYLTSGRALDPSYELYDWYKSLSVLSEKLIPKEEVVSTINACVSAKKRPNTVITLPIHLTLPRNISNKVAVIYDAELEKIFDVSYNHDGVDKIFVDDVNLSDTVISLALSDISNNIVSKVGKEGYSGNGDDAVLYSISFGGRSDIADIATTEENKTKTYSYTLTAAFSKSSLNNHIFVTRSLFGMITALALVVIFLIQRQRKSERDKHHAMQKISHQVHHDIIDSLRGLQLISENIKKGIPVTKEDVSGIKDIVRSIEAIAANLTYQCK
ncbi:hypothetical protein MIDIC_540012 [Alphaproteobacteria bacterium]